MTQPALMLSTDASVLDAGSDTAMRMREYAELYGSVHVIVCARALPAGHREVLPGVWAHPCQYAYKAFGMAKVWRMTRELAQAVGPEVIMAQDAFMFGLAAYIISRQTGVPFVVGIYGTDISQGAFVRESLKHRLYALVAYFVMRRAAAIQTDGPETVERLKERYGDKVFFKPMVPANFDAFKRLRRIPPAAPSRLLFVGRFVPQKNIPLLADVIEAVHERTKGGITFTIVGTGPEHAWFVREVERRDLAGICDIRGSVSREELPALYAAHHALLMVSRYEGFPRVFMEAAVAGLPVVTTEVGGIAGLIEDGESASVVPQGTRAVDIAERIIALSKDSSTLEKLSRGIKERWETLYGSKTVLDYQRPLAEFMQLRCPTPK